MPAGAVPPRVDRIESEPLTQSGVERLLRNVTSGEPAEDEAGELRISIAGAQEKTALLRVGRRWHRPLGATPTTHIFKLPLGLVGNMRADMTASVENEWLCAQLLAALGFDVAPAEIARFGAQKVLVVKALQRSGRIVNVSSVLGFLPMPYGALYAATKHAVEGYSESLDHELRTRGIRVSVIEPAYTKTRFDANFVEPDAKLDEYREVRASLARTMDELMATAIEQIKTGA